MDNAPGKATKDRERWVHQSQALTQIFFFFLADLNNNLIHDWIGMVSFVISLQPYNQSSLILMNQTGHFQTLEVLKLSVT